MADTGASTTGKDSLRFEKVSSLILALCIAVLVALLVYWPVWQNLWPF